MNNQKIIVKRKHGLFLLGYILLYLSYFIGDVNIDGNFGQYIRFLSYGVLLISLFTSEIKLTVKQFLLFFVAIIFSVLLYITTRDLYFTVLIILVLSARDIEEREILQVSYWLLLMSTIFVIMLCLLGVLDNVNTIRNIVDTRTRLGYGFYHSNVLPLILVYITSYRILLKKDRFKNVELLLVAIIGTIVYILCNSRNAYFSLLLLVMFMFVINNFKRQRLFNKIIEILSKISLPVVYTFSISMMFLLLRGGIWNTIENFFSGRFRSAIFKSRSVGIHFINLMSNEDFFADGIILDNGYLYVFLRYGIIMIGMMFVLVGLLQNKIKGNKYGYLVLFVLIVANMLDNDLLDYSCLPFVLIAFTNIRKYHPKSELKELGPSAERSI